MQNLPDLLIIILLVVNSVGVIVCLSMVIAAQKNIAKLAKCITTLALCDMRLAIVLSKDGNLLRGSREMDRLAGKLKEAITKYDKDVKFNLDM